MEIRKIQNAELQGKKVLMRVDFNVAIEDGDIKEKFKIESAKKSIEYVLSQGAKLALVTHLGRPEGEFKEEFSLKQLVDDVEDVIGVKIKLVEDCIGDKVEQELEELSKGEVLLLENVRFHEEEKENSADFSQELAKLFDVFINEAFSVCHRDQASVTGITQFLPSYAGFRLQEEVEALTKAKDNPEHPAVAIIGGAKIETKLPLIKKFEENYDFVLVGGKVANEALDQGISFSDKVILPMDFVGDRFDIGEKTLEVFKKEISGAKTIVWNGPMGKFEDEEFSSGTDGVLNSVISSDGFTLMGGGESVEILEKADAMEKVSFVSTGGGAMLEFMSGKDIPGIVRLVR